MAKERKRPAWKDFEIAVSRFAVAMDPHANISHNHFTPDADTRKGRQRDVWIEAMICGLWPLKVHVSCKRYKRKLHEGAIDMFVGELASSLANLGVLYSHAGFTGPAIAKARVRNICCCRLYVNQPADLPEVIRLESYCCSPQISLQITPYPAPGWNLANLNDVLRIKTSLAPNSPLLVDELSARFSASEQAIVERLRHAGGLPGPFSAGVDVPASEQRAGLRVTAHGNWKVHRARLVAYLVNGSYSFTNERFTGEIATPAVDMQSADPGPGWELLSSPPASIGTGVVMVRFGADAKTVLLEHYG